MKKHIALYAIVAAALLAAPTVTRAQDKPAPKSDAAEAAAAGKKHGVLPFHGKVAAVDTTAKTVTVGTLTFNITSDTKIAKAGKPATLSDITVGEAIRGAYKKDDAGKLNATTIHIGEKGEPKKKKKAE